MFFLPSVYSHRGLWLKAALCAAALHLGLWGAVELWRPAPPPPPSRTKILVQTVALKPFQSQEIPPPPAPQAEVLSIAETPPPPEPLPPSSDPVVPLPEPSPPTTPPSPPAPEKRELSSEREAPSPKPALEKKKKETPAAKTTPAKPSVPPPKKPAKTEAKPSSSIPQKEIDKKRQKEKEEEEKKRQQENAAARQREVALLAAAKENLAKIQEKRDKGSAPLSPNKQTMTLPQELGSLQADAVSAEEGENPVERGTKEASYRDEVAYRLKAALLLPDYGAVEMKLTLDRKGKVIKVEVVRSESSKNKTYAESKVPALLFPPFGHRFPGLPQQTFEITLQNAS